MYNLYGCGESVKKIILLSKPYLKNIVPKNLGDLRIYFHRFLNHQLRNIPVNSVEDQFIDDVQIEKQLATAYSRSTLNDLDQEYLIDENLDKNTKGREIARGRNALSLLHNSNTELGQFFDLVIHSIFYSKSKEVHPGQRAFGGSSSKGVGVIWVSGLDNYGEIDLVEFFLHELTHHLIFVDELCYPQFNYETITKRENFAMSAILKKVRPLDKVVHSVVVCTEILLGRARFLPHCEVPKLHPDSHSMAKNIIKSSCEVLHMPNIDDLVTARIKNMLKDCIEVAQFSGKTFKQAASS